MSEPHLTMRSVMRLFDQAKGPPLHALGPISMDLMKGEFFSQNDIVTSTFSNRSNNGKSLLHDRRRPKRGFAAFIWICWACCRTLRN